MQQPGVELRDARRSPVSGLGLRRIWAATIDFTPDHLPILGPGLTAAGDPIEGVTVASAGGHGMMWGRALPGSPPISRFTAGPT